MATISPRGREPSASLRMCAFLSAAKSTWVWLKMFPLTRVPFWVPVGSLNLDESHCKWVVTMRTMTPVEYCSCSHGYSLSYLNIRGSRQTQLKFYGNYVSAQTTSGLGEPLTVFVFSFDGCCLLKGQHLQAKGHFLGAQTHFVSQVLCM